MNKELPIHPDDELLTAFLDRELSNDERHAVEMRLATDEPFRKRLAGLQQAWDMLDAIPETPINRNLTRSTLEMVAVDIESQLRGNLVTSTMPSAPSITLPSSSKSDKPHEIDLSVTTALVPPAVKPLWTRRLTIVLAISAIIGSLLGLWVRKQSKTLELRGLALSAYLPGLQTFPNINAMEKLLEIPHWEDLLKDRNLQDRTISDVPLIKNPQEVQEWIDKLDVYQKELLWNQKRSLDRLPLQEGLTLLDRYLRIQEHPRAKDLQRASNVMAALLQSIPTTRRAEIESLPIDRQLMVLRQEACFKLSMMHTEELSKEERIAISKWGRDEFGPSLREVMPPNIAQDSLEGILMLVIYLAPQRGMIVLPDQDELSESFLVLLDPTSRTLYEGVAHENQPLIMATWLLETSNKREMLKPPTDEELYKFYSQLPPQAKEKIDLKESAEARERLQWQFRSRQSDSTNDRK